MEKYTVKIVTPKEWQRVVASNLRYQHAEDSVGFADPQTRTGYVMNTGVHRLNRYLLSHEFEHLVEEHATDADEFGVRHKKFFKQILAPIALPILGGLLGGPIGAGFGGAAAGATGATLGGIAGAGLGAAGGGALGAKVSGGDVGKSALTAGLVGGGLKALPAIAGAFGKGGQAAAGQAAAKTGASITGQAAPQAIQGARIGAGAAGAAQPAQQVAFGSSLTSPASRLASGIGGQAAQSPLAAFNLPSTFDLTNPTSASILRGAMAQPSLSPILQGAATAAGGGGGGQPTASLIQKVLSGAKNLATQGLGAAAGGAAMNLFTGQGGIPNYGDLAIAGGLVGAGQAAPTPQVPSLAGLPSVQRLQQATNQGFASDIGRVATTRLNEQLTAPFTGLPGNVSSAIRRPFQEERIQESRNLKAYQPGFNLDEPEYQRAIAPSLRGEADALAVAEQRERERFDVQRRQDVQTALGLDENTFQQLSDLANLDVQEIALQAGIDFEMARDFKQTMGSLAGLFASRGLGLNRFQLVT